MLTNLLLVVNLVVLCVLGFKLWACDQLVVQVDRSLEDCWKEVAELTCDLKDRQEGSQEPMQEIQ